MKVSHHNSRPEWTPAARRFEDGPGRKHEKENGSPKKTGLTFTSGMDRLTKTISAPTGNNGPGQASKAVARASAADILMSQRSLAEARMLQSRAESLRWSPSPNDRLLGLSLMRDATALMQRVDSAAAPQRLEGTGNGVAPEAESASATQTETPDFDPAPAAEPASAPVSCENPVSEPAAPACSPAPCSPVVDTGLIQAIQAVTMALQSMVVR